MRQQAEHISVPTNTSALSIDVEDIITPSPTSLSQWNLCTQAIVWPPNAIRCSSKRWWATSTPNSILRNRPSYVFNPCLAILPPTVHILIITAIMGCFQSRPRYPPYDEPAYRSYGSRYGSSYNDSMPTGPRPYLSPAARRARDNAAYADRMAMNKMTLDAWKRRNGYKWCSRWMWGCVVFGNGHEPALGVAIGVDMLCTE